MSDHPSAKDGWFKWTGPAAIALAVWVACSKPSKETPTTPAPSQSAVPPTKAPVVAKNAKRELPYMVAAVGMWKHYHANEVAADEAYKGKLLLLFGTVEVIRKDPLNNMVIGLRTGNSSVPIHATVRDSEKAAVAALRKGEHVRLNCRGSGMILGTPMVSHCTFPPLMVPEDPEPENLNLASEVPSLESEISQLASYRDVWNDGHESDRRLLLSAISQLVLMSGFAGRVLSECQSKPDIKRAAVVLWSTSSKQWGWSADFMRNLRSYLASIRSEKHLGVRSDPVDRKGGWDFSAIAYLANTGSPAYFREFMQDRDLPGRYGWNDQALGAALPYLAEPELAREYMLTLVKVAEKEGRVLTAQDCSAVGLRLLTSRGGGKLVSRCL